MDESLVFIHLSDIHFNKRGLDHYDVDRDLRDQLERDVSEEMHSVFPIVNRILLSGDIGFAGKKEEYAEARRWPKTLCQLSACDEEDVLCIPGNHDVDRSVYSDSATLQDYHDRLRADDSDKIDEQIARYMRDSIAQPLLFKSIEQYNDFASIFRCPSKPAPLAWQHDLKCNDGSILRVHGINSTLASDPTDDNAGRKLIVGKVQARPKEERGVAYLVMCHHPPDCSSIRTRYTRASRTALAPNGFSLILERFSLLHLVTMGNDAFRKSHVKSPRQTRSSCLDCGCGRAKRRV